MSTTLEAVRQVDIAPAEELRRPWTLIVVLLLFAIVYLGSAFSPSLQDDADSTHAEAAREMYLTGDYVTLHVNGIRYLEKAPLMYWAVAVSYHIFGVNEFATRLPTMLAMLGLILLGMKWSRRAFGERASFYTGLFIATTTGYYLFTRILIPEAILSFLIASAFYSFLTALEDRQTWRWYVGYACIGLAVLTKGLLALVLVGGASLVYLAITGEWRRWREFHFASGLLLLMLIAAPWHIIAGIRNPRFFWFYFVNEHIMRFLGKRVPKDYNKLPGYLYWGLHLVWLFPWSVFVPLGLKRFVRHMQERRADDNEPVVNFRVRTEVLCLVWATVTLLFFALSTNQEYYTFPAYLPILMLLAASITSEEHDARGRWLSYTAAATMILSLAASAVLVAGLWTSRHVPYTSDIGLLLAQGDLSKDTLSMGHALDLTGQSFAALRLPAIIAAIALAIGPVVAWVLRRRRKHAASVLVMAAAMAFFLVAAHIALGRFDPYLSSHNLAEAIKADAKPEDRVMIFTDQAWGSSLLWYLRRPIELVHGRSTSMWWGSTYPDAPKVFLEYDDLVNAWNSGTRVFLFVPSHERAHVDALLPSNKFVIAESSGKVVYSNRR